MDYLSENTHFYDQANWVVSFAVQSKVLLSDLLFRIQGLKLHYFDTKSLGSYISCLNMKYKATPISHKLYLCKKCFK